MIRLNIDRIMPLGLPLPPSFVYVSAQGADKVVLVLEQERQTVAANKQQYIFVRIPNDRLLYKECPP